ncbi:MAG TPA: hypothetical protein GXX46_08455 [Peptococcaceae bacterium]|nr:hypothetical protein [Peptococcaceae bacterium]
MRKIKDRHTLGVVAGIIGTIPKILIDEISLRKNISKRSYRHTAAGVWVNSQKEAMSWKGSFLGTIMDTGLSVMGAIVKLNYLSKYGRDNIILKGALFGTSFGAIITAILSGLSYNKVKPKDAASNLSYVFANCIYGITTALALAKLGDDSLFDSKPLNDYLKPTKSTTDEALTGKPQNSPVPKEVYLH